MVGHTFLGGRLGWPRDLLLFWRPVIILENCCYSFVNNCVTRKLIYCYIGVVGRITKEMANRPLVIPDLFTSDKSWDEWIDHFESVADVCNWDGATKLKWLRVRLGGRAGTVFRRLPEGTRADYDGAKAALRTKFEPESRRMLYQSQLQSRVKQKGEGWAKFGEDLKTLAEKAYPDLEDAAKERFALNQYLVQLNDPQVAFAVKQSKPTTVEDAVRTTLEMESYTKPMPSGLALMSEEVPDTATVSMIKPTRTSEVDLKLILDRMERMETQLRELQQPLSQNSSGGRGRKKAGRPGSWDCWNCGGQGHFARECPSPKVTQSPQGNDHPPALRAKRWRTTDRLM